MIAVCIRATPTGVAELYPFKAKINACGIIIYKIVLTPVRTVKRPSLSLELIFQMFKAGGGLPGTPPVLYGKP